MDSNHISIGCKKKIKCLKTNLIALNNRINQRLHQSGIDPWLQEQLLHQYSLLRNLLLDLNQQDQCSRIRIFQKQQNQFNNKSQKRIVRKLQALNWQTSLQPKNRLNKLRKSNQRSLKKKTTKFSWRVMITMRMKIKIRNQKVCQQALLKRLLKKTLNQWIRLNLKKKSRNKAICKTSLSVHIITKRSSSWW